MEHIRKSARAEAQSFLTDLASRQKHLVDRRRYATSVVALNMATPKSLIGRFADPVTVDTPDQVPPTFRITAQAVGEQAKDKSPTLALDSAGNREPAGCW